MYFHQHVLSHTHTETHGRHICSVITVQLQHKFYSRPCIHFFYTMSYVVWRAIEKEKREKGTMISFCWIRLPCGLPCSYFYISGCCCYILDTLFIYKYYVYNTGILIGHLFIFFLYILDFVPAIDF